MMVTTKDNIICKRGDRVWEIGVSQEGYRPTMSTVHGQGAGRLVNPARCWKDYNGCLLECNKLNNIV